MKVYLLKRFAFAVFTMFFVVTIVFFLYRSGEADPAAIMLPPDATPKDMEILTKNFGLDKPLPIQYLNFLKNALRGDFGKSFRYNEPAAKVLLERFPASIQLGVVSFIFSAIVGLTIGILSAIRRDGWIDRVGRVIALGGMSIPPFWLAVMLMLFFGVTLGWLPVSGRGEGGLDTVLHMILPVFCLSTYPIALITRISMSSMIDALKSDYVTMARIKGVPEPHVNIIHAFKNASITLITIIVPMLVYMILGNVIIENIFSWPGIGRLVVESTFARDYPVVQVFILLITFLITTAYIIADILYALVDQRIRFE
jgi:ABC-type dipeptide/oligopeptide/nickel transport system permease component